MRFLGVDGCRAGWLLAEAGSLRARPSFRLVERFAEIARLARRGEVVACVDMPIGLADAGRRCDAEARAILGRPRSSSVFTPPSRTALLGRTAQAIRRLNRRATGRSLSAQALGILPKIREVDEVMTPRLQRSIREAHPEVIFAGLRGGVGLAAGKKTPAGRRQRLALLPPPFAAALPTSRTRPFPAGDAALDDYVDALALLVAAVRLWRERARRLPRQGQDRDGRGLVMEIRY
jgi:predicted RNase H-like nuclease